MPVFVWMFLVLSREKYTLEQDIREAEEAIRHKSAEVQVRTACFLSVGSNWMWTQHKIETLCPWCTCIVLSHRSFLYIVIFFIYFFKLALSSTCIGFSRPFKVFLWTLTAFLLIFSTVLDHFQGNFYFYLFSHLTLNYESLGTLLLSVCYKKK